MACVICQQTISQTETRLGSRRMQKKIENLFVVHEEKNLAQLVLKMKFTLHFIYAKKKLLQESHEFEILRFFFNTKSSFHNQRLTTHVYTIQCNV